MSVEVLEVVVDGPESLNEINEVVGFVVVVVLSSSSLITETFLAVGSTGEVMVSLLDGVAETVESVLVETGDAVIVLVNVVESIEICVVEAVVVTTAAADIDERKDAASDMAAEAAGGVETSGISVEGAMSTGPLMAASIADIAAACSAGLRDGSVSSSELYQALGSL